jgi:hypothetical protein
MLDEPDQEGLVELEFFQRTGKLQVLVTPRGSSVAVAVSFLSPYIPVVEDEPSGGRRKRMSTVDAGISRCAGCCRCGCAGASGRGASSTTTGGGVPLGEPLLMWWNLVARTPGEIEAARADWRAGRFGTVAGYDGDPLPAPPLDVSRLVRRP